MRFFASEHQPMRSDFVQVPSRDSICWASANEKWLLSGAEQGFLLMSMSQWEVIGFSIGEHKLMKCACLQVMRRREPQSLRLAVSNLPAESKASLNRFLHTFPNKVSSSNRYSGLNFSIPVPAFHPDQDPFWHLLRQSQIFEKGFKWERNLMTWRGIFFLH